jgi:REP element-mobilizing transposase RayT
MKEQVVYAKEHPEFITITCLEWVHILNEDKFKNIITDSLNYLVVKKRVAVYGFVIMSNHFHMIWQMLGDNKRPDVQRDFLKYTSQKIIKVLEAEKSPLLGRLFVNAKDRKYQVWERNSLGISLWTASVFEQKLAYIHTNPVKAGFCELPENYKYSSARYYEKNEKDWPFLSHHDGL